ncbi:hypothetical protein MPY17_13880 [Rhodococcus opacus]|uniref:hypothetical protein n=1 Tax=Rhodococcus opacus TaxID=37919 RepID=UPI001FF20580|nr:hypothetical protein [Rhodococcus opacus]UOT06758.1 hypothetical protein MPY17_13880 [Rhodococcus opacus]
MSRTYRKNDPDHQPSEHRNGSRARKQRTISVRGVRRETPDLQRIRRAIIALAIAEAERDAAASQPPQHEVSDD